MTGVQPHSPSLRIDNLTAQHRAWTAKEDSLLGTMRDEKVARRLKRTLESVKGRCRKLRIPVFAPKRRNWPAEEDKRVASVSLRSGKNRTPARFRRFDVAGRATPASQPQPAAAMAC